jgi:hypothetical protein
MSDDQPRLRAQALRHRAYAHPSYREELAGALEAQRQSGSLSPPWRIPFERELVIIDRYPAMFPDAFVDRRKFMPRPFGEEGISVFSGWLPIVEAFLAKLSGYPDAIVVQIKEKFGALTIYVGDPQSRDEVRELAEAARRESVKTCEFCGAPGRNARMRDSDWLKTMCEACREK